MPPRDSTTVASTISMTTGERFRPTFADVAVLLAIIRMEIATICGNVNRVLSLAVDAPSADKILRPSGVIRQISPLASQIQARGASK